MHTLCRVHTVQNGVDIAKNTFEVKPELGLLQPGELQLISLKFAPQYNGSFQQKLLCVLNDSDDSIQEVVLNGIGCLPSLTVGAIDDTVSNTTSGVMTIHSANNTHKLQVSIALCSSEVSHLVSAKISLYCVSNSTYCLQFTVSRLPTAVIYISVICIQMPYVCYRYSIISYILTHMLYCYYYIDDTVQHEVYMKPTCVGISTARTVVLRNTSRIPLVFSTAVPAELSGVFSVVPTAGTLQGNDSIKLKVAFAPRQSTAYTLKLPIEVNTALYIIYRRRC
jgi:hypothetical protein